MKKSICFIGARGGSKGVPRKNIRKIGGKPLIAYSIESALKSKIFSHVIVSTEDKEIASISERYGAEVPFLRPKKLATDRIGFAPVLYHGIKKLYSLGYDFDIIVQRDCTAPFIRIKDVTIDFTFKINTLASDTSKDETTKAASVTASGGFWGVKVSASASYSNTKASESKSSVDKSAELKMHVNATQDEMPEGLKIVLTAITGALAKSVETGTDTTDTNPTLPDDKKRMTK